jgi:hypothetical protein
MAKTRAALTRELGAIRSRVFGIIPVHTGEKIMATKTKSKSKKSKTPGKAMEIVEHVLAGAALGAVKGVAEAIVPEIEKSAEHQSKSAGAVREKSDKR